MNTRSVRLLDFISSVIFASLCLAAVTRGQATFTRLAPGSGVAGLSVDGSVAMGFYDAAATRTFRWTRSEGFTDIIDHFQGHAISGDGNVIAGGPTEPPYQAVSWTKSQGVVPIGVPSGLVKGISRDGAVMAGFGSLPGLGLVNQAFRWTQSGGAIGLGFLPGSTLSPLQSFASGISGDGSVIVGTSSRGKTPTEAFRWTEADGMKGLGFLSGLPTYSNATAVSADGRVVVGFSGNEDRHEAFRWTESGGMVGLGSVSGNVMSMAYAVSGDGSIIVGGLQSLEDGPSEAFVWTAHFGMCSLAEILTTEFGLGEQLAGWQLTGSTAISSNGRIIGGSGFNPDGIEEGWLVDLGRPFPMTPIPEPETYGLIAAVGLLMLIRYRTRRAGSPTNQTGDTE